MKSLPPHLGNARLLALPKTALLSSRRVLPSAVMRCYDWATEARDAERCVASGFQSALERDVFSFLLRGTSPIVLVLARSLWKAVPKEFREPIAVGRLLIVSPVPQSANRVSEETAAVRNGWILDHCDEAVFASLEALGYVARVPSATDARSVVVRLTPEGEALRPAFDAISRRFARFLYAGLDRKESETLERLLGKTLSGTSAQRTANAERLRSRL